MSASHGGSPSSSTQSSKHRFRHTPLQSQMLEEHFAVCAHPDGNEREAIARELGLTPRQVKVWFQNKRIHIMTLTKRSENHILRAQNENMRYENQAFREGCRMRCSNCEPVHSTEETDKLVQENIELRKQIAEVYAFLCEQGVDPTPPLDQNLLNPPSYEVNSTTPRGGNLRNPTPEPSFESGSRI